MSPEPCDKIGGRTHSPHSSGCFSLEVYLLERKQRGGSGGGVTLRIATPVPGVGWFKSNLLGHAEGNVTDVVKKSKGASSVIRE